MLLVIDIESFIYKACTACNTIKQDEKNPNIFMEVFDITKGLDYLDNFIESLKNRFPTNDVELVVGDKENWRKGYCPTYKANRKETPKPAMYYKILERLYNIYPVTSLPNLEADDTCRIINEDTDNYPMRKVLVSIDKDFKTFPCELHNPLHNTTEVINEQQANYNLMKQIIMGDKADNYSGIDGWGEAKATKFMDDEPRTFEDVQQLFKEQGQLKDYKTNLNLAAIVSIDRYNFDTGKVRIL